MLKFFPAEASGGVRWLKAVVEPLPEIRFCPTGGINGDNAASYLALANVLAVGGSWVAPAEAIAAGDFAGITRAPAPRRACKAERGFRCGLASRTGSIVSRSTHQAPPAQSLRLVVRRPSRSRSSFPPRSSTGATAQARFLEILISDTRLFVDMLPKVLAGLPDRRLRRRADAARDGDALGRRRVRASLGILIATLAGTICPGGPITIFPIAAAFVAIGADTGAAIAFVTSWTLLGYARVLVWELPFFGARVRDLAHDHLAAAADCRRLAGARLIGRPRSRKRRRRR